MEYGTLDVFRVSVAAAALGFAHRALDVETSALLVYRAASARAAGAERITLKAAMAKLRATEAAQRVIDAAVHLHGGRGVQRGSVPERLSREIRALRIYGGTSEIQKLVIAAQPLEE